MLEVSDELKVYLDDKRSAPEGFVRCYWPEEAIALLKTGRVVELSLDHDLGDDDRGTGYDVILWIEEQVFLNGFTPPPVIKLHTDNASAKQKMLLGVNSIYKLDQLNKKTSV